MLPLSQAEEKELNVSGWIGVDLDGTLARHDGWASEEQIGPPISAMVDRVKDWLAQGIEVRIFTARVTQYPGSPAVRFDEVRQIVAAIEGWCVEHIGVVLPVTNVKDYGMIELWDDRCIQVISNTGERVGAVPSPQHLMKPTEEIV